jgi:hypothetical protein
MSRCDSDECDTGHILQVQARLIKEFTYVIKDDS